MRHHQEYQNGLKLLVQNLEVLYMLVENVSKILG